MGLPHFRFSRVFFVANTRGVCFNPRTMKIKLPEGFQIPQNVAEGEPFESVVTFLPTPDGMATITSIDGVKIAEETEMEEPEETEASEAEEFADPEIQLPFGEGM